MFNLKWKDFKGLRWYMLYVLVTLSFFAYSQSVGWKWIGATSTKPPEQTQGGNTGNRLYLHK